MYRLPLALALTASATTAMAHDHAAQTPPAKPASATPARTVAQLNALAATPLPADQAAMKAHVLFLASDAMRGREAGSPEYDIAAQYVAAQFYAAGLRPGGEEGGYLQRVPLVAYKLEGAPEASVGRTPLVHGQDYIAGPNPARGETRLTAPVVFAGWGVDAPTYGHDDFAGTDVRGKIVAVFGGAPARFDGEERAFHGSASTKAQAAARRGAAGLLIINSAQSEARRPFASLVANADRPRYTWAKPDGTGATDAPDTPQLGTLSQAGAAKIFGPAWRPIAKQAGDANARFKPLSAPGTMTIATRTSFAPALSSNVVGLIPGSDPKLRDQVVVLSAHLDHIGVDPVGTGEPTRDRINNGAMDNAMGIASLIEEAKRFKADPKQPRRTVMFLAVTAEEKGLIGSDYFANHPTVPLANIVADVNLDMPILTYRFEDMIVFGADRSTLGPIVRDAAASVGVTMSPDPLPEQGLFVRSDHFRFVEKGVPSVFLWPGQKGPGKAAYDAFFLSNYHKPSDEVTLPIDWSQGPRFVGVNYAIARAVADADERPVWNKGDYFGTLFKGRMGK
ncbi:M28 family metallopeptidase [uncultured Sphingomonas sp.]|uniref:M28 family metallopeptidase n=1 Tax=uncultured Sphingomonas sp. TaxID=158754 RepID=UPI0035CAFF48